MMEVIVRSPTKTTSDVRPPSHIQFAVFVLVFFCLSFGKSVNLYSLTGIHEEIYSQHGDINVGSMINILNNDLKHHSEICRKEVKLSSYAVEASEALAYAVNLVNRNPYILPNVSLGFTVRATCESTAVTLGTAVSFLSQNKNICNRFNHSIQALVSTESHQSNNDVIGVVGVGRSQMTLPVSALYAVGQLPLVGPTETSDELSNKRKHPYFFRVVSPDMYQIQAMLKFIFTNGWSYISVVYMDGSYGLNAFDRINKNAGRYGICIATSHRLIQPVDYDLVVSDLLLNYRARVVVIFIDHLAFRDILQIINEKNATGHFIFIASDSLNFYKGYDYKGLDYDPAIGTITFDTQTTFVTPFYDYLKQQKVTTTGNPWMKQTWEYLFGCSFDSGTCDSTLNVLHSRKYKPLPHTALRIDSVLTLAQAAHNLLSSRCPDARGYEARDCITGKLMRDYLKNTAFDGFSGRIKFDENQDVEGKYVVNQIFHDYLRYPFMPETNNTIYKKGILRKSVGVYDISTDTLTYSKEKISWSHIASINRFVNWTEDFFSNQGPQSVCSIPCRVGEYKIGKELPCCWECQKCRDNERLVDDNTTCEPCPSFMWPDATSGFTICSDIPLTYPRFMEPVPIVFTCLAVFALICTMFVTVCYIIYRNEKVIMASSKELSVIQLFAIFIGYATTILFQIKPSDTLCSTVFILFCMSFSLLYSPLLVKTVRIYRIFMSGKKNQRPRFISPSSQVAFTTFLIMIQTIICITVYILFWPRARRTQPIWTEKLVELSCDLTFPGITSFLGYNIVLVSLCSVFAFMVRKLPDNFNESKFISMCVSTTLLIFLAFIPAYFTADRQFVRGFLLSVALFLNHSVALLFLFAPKIYAARFLSPEAGNVSKK